MVIGISWLFTGQYGQAQQELRRALASVRAVNNRGQEGSIHCWLGYLALIEMDCDHAQTAFEEGYRLYQAAQGDTYTFLALSGLGFSTCCRGDLDQSRHHFIQLLTEGLRRKDFLYLLVALPGLALYLAKRGDMEQAAAAWAQAQCWPYVANSLYYEDVVGKVLAEATTDMPANVLSPLRESGRSLGIWGMAEQLLAELLRHS